MANRSSSFAIGRDLSEIDGRGEVEVWLLARALEDVAAGRLGNRSTAVGRVIDEAVFDVGSSPGSGVGFPGPIDKALEEENSRTGRGVVAIGPASLNPNFLNASTPSPTLGTSQTRTRVRWYVVPAAKTAARRNNR